MKKLFKPLKGERLSHAYLYGDGHLVVIFGKWDHTYQRSLERAEVIEKYARPSFSGRLVIHECGILPTIQGARVRASLPTIENGSENTRRLNLAVGTVSIESEIGSFHVSILECLSGPFTYQPDVSETFEEVSKERCWSDTPISKVRLSPPLTS